MNIGKDSNISGSVVADETIVGDNCYLENGTLIGHKVTVGNKSIIHSGVKVWPEIKIDQNSSIKETLFNSDYDINCESS